MELQKWLDSHGGKPITAVLDDQSVALIVDRIEILEGEKYKLWAPYKNGQVGFTFPNLEKLEGSLKRGFI